MASKETTISPSPKPMNSSSSTATSDSTPTSPVSSIVSPSISTVSSLSTPATSDITLDAIPHRKTEAPPKDRSRNGYIARVGFDTLDCEDTDTAQYTFTIQAKTDKWQRTKHTRSFLVGTDLNDYSSHALHWVMDKMIEDGDEIIALRVIPIELRDSFAKSGIPSFQGQEIAARTEATKIMEMIRSKNKSKDINIIVECRVGNVRETIQAMVQMYEPSMLVVGTKGRSSIKGFLLGSISRYCLNHSPVPVTVVRPANQLSKSRTKAKGIFRSRNNGVQIDASELENQPQLFYSSPLSRQTSRASVDSEEEREAKETMAELERKSSRSSDTGNYYYHHHYETAASKASAAKRQTTAASTIASLPNPTQSINSSLSFASELLSDTTPPSSADRRFSAPPEGIIRLTKSLTTDGTTGQSSSYTKKTSTRRGFSKLSPSILLGFGSRKRNDS